MSTEISISTSGGSDENVKISSADTTTDFLENKLVAGANISLTKVNAGGNEQIEVTASGGGASGHHIQLLPGGTYFGGIYQTNTNTGGSNYSNQTFADRMSYFPFIPNQDFTSTEMRINCNLASAGDEARLSIYSHDGINAPQNLLYESSALDMSTLGYKTVNVTRNWTKGEIYWLGIHTKTGGCRIIGMGTNISDSLIIGVLSGSRIKMWQQTGQTFANGAPATANPNTYRLDVYMVEFK